MLTNSTTRRRAAPLNLGGYDTPPRISTRPVRQRALNIPRNLLWGLYAIVCVALYFIISFLFRKNPRLWIQPYRDPVIVKALARIETELAARPLPRPADGGRYVHFANQVKHAGFNNVLNEVLLLSHLAQASGRSYVHRPLWLHQRPTLPLQAFISGPAAGAGGTEPHAVSVAQYDAACPLRERRYISTTQVRQALGLDGQSDALEHMTRWSNFLRNMPERCVEVLRGTPLVFDYDLVVSPRIVSLWPIFSTSPIVTNFAWSPLVERGLKRVLPRFATVGPAGRTETELPGLAVVHVRRGDFKEHCDFLAGWLPLYTSWNLLPNLPDSYNAPSPQNYDDFQRRCFPTVDQIVARLHAVRKPGQNRIYIATNGKGAFLDELKRALRQDGWLEVTTSRDIEQQLPADERLVSQGIDMELAARADLFVGNGFSSLTATIVMLRLSRGRDAQTIRFW